MIAAVRTLPPAIPHTQSPPLPVRVGRWERDEDFPFHPVGSKPKRVLICPPDSDDPILRPGRAYLFKIAEGWRAQQMWSELIAYQLGALIGVDVPACFVALDETTTEVGNLIEFFYDYPEQPEPVRFIHAADFMRHRRGEQRTDRPHGVRTNLRICRVLGLPEPVNWWGQVLTFDALIGNTDRHPENWGFLFERKQTLPVVRFAPAFDNGTSLGYEQTEARLPEVREPASLNAYINKGTHHCGWDATDDGRGHHIELCERYMDAYPQAGPAMRRALQFDVAQIAEILAQCTAFDVNVAFSAERADFVAALVEARRSRLMTALEGM